MKISFDGNDVRIASKDVTLPWPILEAFDDGSRVIILLDPDAYLSDTAYKEQRRLGMPPIKNLIALGYNGNLLWEADFPTDVDYYYRISSKRPLVVNSYSSFACAIDPATGKINEVEFYK